MKIEDLKILVMFCSNRINGDKFLELMTPRYNDENYIMRLWPSFRDNPCMFIVSRSETELFDGIIKIINDTNYKG